MDEVEAKGELRTILEAIDKIGKSKKDSWDKLQTLSTVLAAVLIPVVLAYASRTFDERQRIRDDRHGQEQNRVLELQILEKFTPHLASTDDKTNEVAILAICALGNQELATQLARLLRSRGAATALDHIQSSGTACAPKEEAVAPPPVTAVPPPLGLIRNAKQAWVYLGDYSEETERWVTRYFLVGENVAPTSLKGTLVAKTSVNVRAGLPNPDGTFPPVVDVLNPGSRVTVLEVRKWQTTGFTWARVSYVTR